MVTPNCGTGHESSPAPNDPSVIAPMQTPASQKASRSDYIPVQIKMQRQCGSQISVSELR